MPGFIYLSESHTQHDQDAGAGPEGDPPQVVLQQVAVSRLKGLQHRLHLPAALQAFVQRVHGLLRGRRGSREEGRGQIQEVRRSNMSGHKFKKKKKSPKGALKMSGQPESTRNSEQVEISRSVATLRKKKPEVVVISVFNQFGTRGRK